MTITPVLDWIVVRVERPKDNKTGLVLPFGLENSPTREVPVHAVGPGRPSEYSGAMIYHADGAGTPCRPGDRILMPTGAGTGMSVKEGDVEYRWIRPGDVLGIVSRADSAGTADLAPVKAAA